MIVGATQAPQSVGLMRQSSRAGQPVRLARAALARDAGFGHRVLPRQFRRAASSRKSSADGFPGELLAAFSTARMHTTRRRLGADARGERWLTQDQDRGVASHQAPAQYAQRAPHSWTLTSLCAASYDTLHDRCLPVLQRP
jgi:hypothetical protein